jgi:CRP/FNR family transcriptional regulator, anaerobic regulatory protein
MKGARQEFFTVKAGYQIECPPQSDQDVLVLCSGWAFRYLQLADGSRQILRFLLPGDIISAPMIFSEDLNFSVRALTEVQISRFGGDDIRKKCLADERVMIELLRSLAESGRASYELAAALGQLPAERRIAHLFLGLIRRIAARSIMLHQRYPMPLRQRHVGDAVGLTPVHVSRVLALFRDRQVLTLVDGVLEVTALAELERLGSLR